MSASPPSAGPQPQPTAWTRTPARRARPDRRRFVSLVCAVLDLAVLALVVGGVDGRVRELAGLVFCVFVPGWSIVGLARIRDAVLELSLSMATGLASLVVLAQFVITVKAWHLVGIEVGVCIACFASLAIQLLGPKRDAR